MQNQNKKPKKNSQTQSKATKELLDSYEDDFDDVQHTLREFDFNRKNFYCFSSDDFE